MNKLFVVLLWIGLFAHNPVFAEDDMGTPGFYVFTGKMYYSTNPDGTGGWYCEYIEDVTGERQWMFFADNYPQKTKT